jgi:hypothetical protein
MAERGTAISTDHFPTNLWGDFLMEAETGAHSIFQDIDSLLQEESFTFQYDKIVRPMINSCSAWK